MTIATTPLPPAEALHRYFKYSGGELLWRVKAKGTAAAVGTRAGDHGGRTCEYFKVSVPGFGRFLLHRVVWVMFNGPIPDGKWVDHINRVKTDNSISNLRLVDWAANQRNTKAKNRTGLPKHVHKTSTGKYAVIIRVGTFNSPAQAEAAALIAVQQLQV